MSKRIVLLQALESTPRDYALTVKGTSPELLFRRPAPAEWSIGDVLSHLIDVEQRYRQRLQRVLNENNPSIPWFGPDESTHDPTIPLENLLTTLIEERGVTLALLKSLSPGQWQCPAVHETYGKTTLRFLVQNLVNHDIEHLNQVLDIQQQLKAAANAK